MDRQGCTVTILRPQETGFLVCNTQPEHYNAYLDEWLDVFREQLEAVAEEHRLPLHLRDHQLTAILPDHRERRWIGESDVLTVVNPEDELIEEVEQWMRRNPVLRTILGFSSVVDRDALLDFCRKFRIPLFDRSATVSRIFTLQLQEEERIQQVVSRALLCLLPPPATPTAASRGASRRTYPPCDGGTALFPSP